jgi:hypothetical protein
MWNLASTVMKLVAVDVILLILLLIWLRRKKDGRLEAAVRVLLGDTVAQVQKVGTGVQREMQRGVGKVGRVLGAAQKRGGGPI